MTLRRSHLWISLVLGVLVWGAYFVHFALGLADGRVDGLAPWFLGALAVTVLGEALATGLIARLFGRRERALDDGPTLLAALKASHIALMLLIAQVLVAAAALAVAALFGRGLPIASPDGMVVAANVLLAMVVVAELARAGFTLALIPRR